MIAACLRNTDAVGRFLSKQGYGTPARPVAVIAAGERWPASGRELTGYGFGDDVAVAVETNSCHFVPVLTGSAFTAAGPPNP